MERDDEGWWCPAEPLAGRCRIGGEGVGEFDYGFLLDDSDTVLPDPRSRRQPDGVHGWSRTFDPDEFVWSDQMWTGRQLGGGIIYELHVGTFTPEGTLTAAIDRLDHLVELGIDFVELMPVNAFNGPHNWGYDGVLWYAVHEAYGGPLGLHAVRRRLPSGRPGSHPGRRLQPSRSERQLPVASSRPYLRSDAGPTVWGDEPNLDGEESDEVRRYIIDNALMFLTDYHVDGLRLDAVHALHDTRATHLLEELNIDVSARSTFLRRPMPLIAESDLNDPRLITAREGGGYGLTAQWSDDFHHALYVSLTGDTSGYYADFDSLAALGKVFESGFFHTGTRSSFRGRTHGHPIDTWRTPTWRLVVCSDNHDQIGNRATGRTALEQDQSGTAGHRGHADAAQSVHADDLHGRGVGCRDAVALLHLPSRARARRDGAGGSARGVRPDGVGHQRCARSAGPADLRGVEAGLVGARDSPAMPSCWT